MLRAEIRKISECLSEIFHFLVVKISVYLNRHVFVMDRDVSTQVVLFSESVRNGGGRGGGCVSL